eukprot:CAMPEP_0168425070 /NCGR_PEP_ID=MMETSP0228-20121227/35140_1 /TAXON_ID=133427 /ORGANISM="Protoceratium reticulatum, Strain CCCM 535 (=CCMP 1889)" /LENGTH=118 /DNA_ID=CAMNT_0008439063 /DNA_START=286 /DNA_END=642 /DNA_ORIENTATION=-
MIGQIVERDDDVCRRSRHQRLTEAGAIGHPALSCLVAADGQRLPVAPQHDRVVVAGGCTHVPQALRRLWHRGLAIVTRAAHGHPPVASKQHGVDPTGRRSSVANTDREHRHIALAEKV